MYLFDTISNNQNYLSQIIHTASPPEKSEKLLIPPNNKIKPCDTPKNIV